MTNPPDDLAEDIKLVRKGLAFIGVDEMRSDDIYLRSTEALDRIAARLAQPVMEGWRLVPVEPTKEMTLAGWLVGSLTIDTDQRLQHAYIGMISAAPQPLRVSE